MRRGALLLLAARCWADESIVDTPLGRVQGVLNPIARTFLGIPYAAPPVGAAGRWAPPAI